MGYLSVTNQLHNGLEHAILLQSRAQMLRPLLRLVTGTRKRQGWPNRNVPIVRQTACRHADP